MIVVICVGLAAIWIGGCLLRRRQLRKRDRVFEMNNPAAAWGPSASHPDFTAAGVTGAPQMHSKEAFSMSRSSSGIFGGGPQDHASFYQTQNKGKSPLAQEVVQEKQPGKISKYLPGRH